MTPYELIKKKRDGGELTPGEITHFITGYLHGEIPDYQMAAFLMAVYFRGMTKEETTALTFCIRDSGTRADFSRVNGIRADKHSTGGVGDKTTFVVIPIVASLGVKAAKMSGRGLGHTGGTVDKLEAFSGVKTEMGQEEFITAVNKAGACVIGQSGEFAPADKLLYALRDVTATVDSIPLITASIMGKKLAADDDCIVLDVKVGSGAFMKDMESARVLAQSMVRVGKDAGKKIRALITNMDEPLGYAVGNALEVVEAIQTLKGKGPKDVTELSISLAAHILQLAGVGDYDTCETKAREAIISGAALKTFADMIEVQGGSSADVYTENLPKAKFSKTLTATKSGYIVKINAEEVGISAGLLGAGRQKKEDVIFPAAGILLNKKVGDYVEKGEVLATLYAEEEVRFLKVEGRVLSAFTLGNTPSAPRKLILDRVE
ncbi:MAG: thymidine phosphorylase [Clostridiales bacterium]|nr:thymidine phosphorylase [Clostridiales bacterium]